MLEEAYDEYEHLNEELNSMTQKVNDLLQELEEKV